MEEDVTEYGTIAEVKDYGSIVMLILITRDQRLVRVPFDHRSFSHLLQREDCSGQPLVGRPAMFDGKNFFFLDGEPQ